MNPSPRLILRAPGASIVAALICRPRRRGMFRRRGRANRRHGDRSPAAAATASTRPSVEASVAASPSAAPLITAMPSAPDSGVTRDLVAKGGLFVPTALSAPAGQVWHIKFDQQDNKAGELIKHNFTIASIVTTETSPS